jgi:hypothetical protein
VYAFPADIANTATMSAERMSLTRFEFDIAAPPLEASSEHHENADRVTLTNWLWKIAVNLFAVQASHEYKDIALENHSDAILSDFDSIVVTTAFEFCEPMDLVEALRSLDLLYRVAHVLQDIFVTDFP